jgi:putative transposase
MFWKPTRYTKAQLEERRTKGFEMLDTGFPPTEIAADLGVSRQVVHKWKQTYDQYGLIGAKAKLHPGTKKLLNPNQLQELKSIILNGAKAQGFPSDAWTCPRVASVIQTQYNVDYSVRHVGYVLYDLGLSPQKPETRALKRDEQKIQTWVLERLPELKKSTSKESKSSLVTKQGQGLKVVSRTPGV